MKIYIAGQIIGLEYQEAFDLFEDADHAISLAGHMPLNPMEVVDQTKGRQYADYLLDALRVVLTEADALYMLPNWQKSKGARIEHAIAEIMEKPIYYSVPDTRDIARGIVARRREQRRPAGMEG